MKVNSLKDPPAPRHLSREAKSWWREIVRAYQIRDEGGLLLLQTVLEAFDRMREAQAALQADGILIREESKAAIPHPAVRIEKDARAQFLLALKMLNLDLEPLKQVGRPTNFQRRK